MTVSGFSLDNPSDLCYKGTMKQALYTCSIRIEWDNADGTIGLYVTGHGCYAPSRKAALRRAERVATSLPCFIDRERAGLRVAAEVRLAEVSPSDGHRCAEPFPRHPGDDARPAACLDADLPTGEAEERAYARRSGDPLRGL